MKDASRPGMGPDERCWMPKRLESNHFLDKGEKGDEGRGWLTLRRGGRGGIFCHPRECGDPSSMDMVDYRFRGSGRVIRGSAFDAVIDNLARGGTKKIPYPLDELTFFL